MKMLTKIIYKNFRSNLKNYILFFLSNIVAIMELFVFYGIRSIIKNSITDKVTAEALKTDFQIAVGIIAVITLMLMFYAMKCYIKLISYMWIILAVIGISFRRNNSIILRNYTDYHSSHIISWKAYSGICIFTKNGNIKERFKNDGFI